MTLIRLLLVLALFLPLAGNVLDDGTGIDPHGGRLVASTDEGNGLDPHGKP